MLCVETEIPLGPLIWDPLDNRIHDETETSKQLIPLAQLL